jgi:hypothetical protein
MAAREPLPGSSRQFGFQEPEAVDGVAVAGVGGALILAACCVEIRWFQES